MKQLVVAAIAALVWLGAAAPTALGQQPLAIKPLAEKKVPALPPGELYWRIDNFASVAQAQAAATPWSLVAQSADRVWLFTLGPAGGSSPGGSRVVEVGPIPRVSASEYLLRINEASGAPGNVTPVHSHPGSEAFFVLAGEQAIRHPHGVMRVKVGQPQAGHGADVPMQVSSSGSTDLLSLVMFVVDATRPFSTPAKFADGS